MIRDLEDAQKHCATQAAISVLEILRDKTNFGVTTIDHVDVNGREDTAVTLQPMVMNKLWRAMCDKIIADLSAGRSALAALDGQALASQPADQTRQGEP
jgi:hypothetical protein